MGDFDYSAACSTVAKITEGMSGREITNLALDWQMTTYASLEGVFTEEIMLQRAKAAVEHKKHKVRLTDTYLMDYSNLSLKLVLLSLVYCMWYFLKFLDSPPIVMYFLID